ncbi:MAG: hypothetical protein M1826_006932 [Phylliscum demangeonii]|nr:MAG: hypothetical protein M1826_006932 [Phylliscum demangeonii]
MPPIGKRPELRGRRAWTPCTLHAPADQPTIRMPLRAREEIWKSERSAAAAREPTLSAPCVAMSAAPRPARTGMDRAATSAVDASQLDIIGAAGAWVISTTRHAARQTCRIGPSPLGTSPGPAGTFPAAPSRSEPRRAEARHRAKAPREGTPIASLILHRRPIDTWREMVVDPGSTRPPRVVGRAAAVPGGKETRKRRVKMGTVRSLRGQQ